MSNFIDFGIAEKQYKGLGTSITRLFGIKYPIVQGGMIWHSGWKLASAVSNAGGLGLIGAGSMYPDVLREHILKCQKATQKPFGVNVPMLYPNIEEILSIIIELGVKIVFTSAGNPTTYTSMLQSHGIKVAHVVSSTKFALKSQQAGVDAVVAEGFEAGGHNGRDETTTMVLIPSVRQAISLPLIAAGGIALGSQMKAAMVLGADGVQVGSRFAATKESSGHQDWKELITTLEEGATKLTLKELAPVRLVKNAFFEEIEKIYSTGRDPLALKELLGRGRSKKGMFEGDLKNGELEIGQVSALLRTIPSAGEVLENMLSEYRAASIPEL
ncbi:NAD(P)H-dependent flavin oxidoreductase [Planobacterium oryzisoli]|uniref:NAD(P)H-dependent flavin oxidoreductase n=1 Tax=Planobacterium oryzisoli TaxID=2771435 RepID=UPI00389A5500